MLESVKVTIVDEKLIDIFKNMSLVDKNRVTETAVLYYSRYIEENPGVENYVYDIAVINSEEEIQYKKVEYKNRAGEELRAEALYCIDAYIKGEILVKFGKFKDILDELVIRRKFDTYPPEDIEVKEYKRESEWVSFRYNIHDRKVRRVITSVKNKTSYVDIFIEKALKYYIDLLKANPIIMDTRLESRI